jgi:formylglycine-generating enzyme required for sulfatase activity
VLHLRAADWLPFLVLALASGMSASCEGGDAGGPPPSTPRDVQAAEGERTGWPLELTNDLGQRFRLIPAATFTMGSPEGEPGRGDDETCHEVKLVRPYYLQTTEVTNAQYRRYCPDHASGEGFDGDAQPVVRVSWEDAEAYAAWLAERDPRFVYRLPTEAEWEHACRAGGGAAWSCADRLAAADATEAVGTRPANAWGLHDLHGNAAEWCHDRYGPYPLWLQQSPQGAASGEERVARGGCWVDPPQRTRTAARSHHPAAHRGPTVGFRLAFGLSYGRTDHGRYTVEVRTIDPTVDEGEDRDRPGWPIYMISVVDRLTDRVNQIPDPRWTLLREPSPLTLRLAPGIYYVYAFRMEGERRVRSIERKFNVPGPEIVECPIPRKYQAHPQ